MVLFNTLCINEKLHLFSTLKLFLKYVLKEVEHHKETLTLNLQ